MVESETGGLNAGNGVGDPGEWVQLESALKTALSSLGILHQFS